MPIMEIDRAYAFEGPEGKASLLDLFEGRRQLILYHFMFAPGVDGWPDAGCSGCSFFVDQIADLAHLAADVLCLQPADLRSPASSKRSPCERRAIKGVSR